VVERYVDRLLAAGKQQTASLRVLAHDIDDATVRKTLRDLDPPLPSVPSAIDVRPEIVESQRVDGGICGTGIEVRRFDAGYFCPRDKRRRRDVDPVHAAVARRMNQAIVRARPDDVGVDR